MNILVKVSEVTENISTLSDTRIRGQVQMTNTSNSYINNLKLIIKEKKIPILEQCIIRQRGSLSFDPNTLELIIGNLAPDETAYFEYTFNPLENITTLPSLSSQMTISYTPEYAKEEISENIIELLDTQ